ncbi:hypothetical protein OSTOST_21520, partial [Ostertagia ostertagi]
TLFTHHSSLSSLPSSSSLSPHSEVTSYNSRCLRKFTPEDVYQLRRELQADYATQRTVAERRRCLREACATLFELRSELLDEQRRNDSSMAFFVFEYQAFLCWIYTTIRFAGFTSEMDRHFREMKEHHRILLSALPARGEPFLLAVLRFSQMCVEYAALCDEEALQWCRLAYARNLPRKKSSSSNTTRSASSLSSSSSSSDVDEVLARRDSDASPLCCRIYAAIYPRLNSEWL